MDWFGPEEQDKDLQTTLDQRINKLQDLESQLRAATWLHDLEAETQD
jgi:hypothetical protein